MSNVLRSTPGAPGSNRVAKTPSKNSQGSQGSQGVSSRSPHPDRFIPNRAAMDMDHAHYNLTACAGDTSSDCGSPTGGDTPTAESANSGSQGSQGSQQTGEAGGSSDENGGRGGYASTLAASMMMPSGSKVLAFKPKPPTPRKGFSSDVRVLYSQNSTSSSSKGARAFRSVPQVPERVLDAPDLLDDYYLNLLDWSSTNVLAVALRECVYLWNASTGTIQQLMQLGDGADEDAAGYVSSISWSAEGNYLAVGTSTAEVQLWDVTASKKIRSMKGHQARVGSLAWNAWLLSSGSRDSSIHNHDVRARQHHTATLTGHEQEVCGLAWSPDGSQLASGGNDNILNVYDNNGTDSPRFRLAQHQAAVKAVAWAPWQSNLLASGGGTADRCIKMWNTSTGACLNSVDTESQVCALQWSKTEREIVSSHGYSQNQLCVWKYPSMAKIAELTAHTSRVLHMAQSPDGSTIVSGGADETLRFWNLGYQNSTASKKHTNTSGFAGMNIR